MKKNSGSIPVFRICDNLYGSGSADPYLWLSDPDPALFVSNLQDAKKIHFFWLITFWRYICIILQKQKVIKKSRNKVEIKFFLTTFAIRIRIRNTGIRVVSFASHWIYCTDGLTNRTNSTRGNYEGMLRRNGPWISLFIYKYPISMDGIHTVL
jgi:hypothetical protein